MVYRDSLGNVYKRVPPPKNNPGPKPSKGGNRKHGRNKRKPSFIRWCQRNRKDS